MKKIIIFIVLFSSVLFPQSQFSNFIASLNSAPNDSVRTKMIDSFIVYARTRGIPFIEDSTVNFIYRGNGTNVYLAGDMNGWSTSSDKFNRVINTNFFYLTKVYEMDARLDYKFIVDGNWILDPENPRTVPGGFGPNSELAMPNYIQPQEILYNPNIPHGKLFDTTFYSTNLNNSRTIRIYTPPNYATTPDSFPLIVVHDGLEYVSLASMHNVLDYLIARNEIEPIVAVFIPPVSRNQEYAGNKMVQFTNFIVNELLPYIENRYRIKRSPQYRAVAGASNGGNISLWLALNHPEVFGNVAAQSSNVITSIQQGFQNSPKLNLKVYLDIGKYDISVLIPLVRNLKTTLQVKGYNLLYKEYNEGHSWGNWRAHIDDFLKFFFPKLSSDVNENFDKSSPIHFNLYQSYPNPFSNESVRIKFKLNDQLKENTISLTKDIFVTIKIFDILGREVKTILNQELSPGNYEITLSGNEFAAGIYYYQMQVYYNNLKTISKLTQTRKMVCIK